MRFKSYSFMFIFIFCFVLFLCTALQAELVKNYDSKTDETIINTKPTQIMDLNPWKQPRLSITIRYPGQKKPSPADLTKLKVKMSFISLSRKGKFDNYKEIQCFADGELVFQRKFELYTNTKKGSVMETMIVNVLYDEFEEMIVAQGLKFNFCEEEQFEKLRMCHPEIELHEIELEDIPRVRELLRGPWVRELLR